jgi:hypothetical protein
MEFKGGSLSLTVLLNGTIGIIRYLLIILRSMMKSVLKQCLVLLWAMCMLALAGCASTPRVDTLKLQSENYKFEGVRLIEVIDGRAPGSVVEEKLNTASGVGLAIDAKTIEPPVFETVNELIQQSLETQGRKEKISAAVNVNNIDIAYVTGRASGVVMNPGVAGGVAAVGGIVGVALVQLVRQAYADSKVPNSLETILKMSFRDVPFICEGTGFISGTDYSGAWQQSLRNAATNCGLKIMEIESKAQETKAIAVQ